MRGVGDIPLMRAGLVLMVVIAAVGGLSLILLPEDRDGGGDKDGRGRLEATVVPPAAAANPSAGGTEAGGGAPLAGGLCRTDASGIALPDAVHESSGLALAAGGDALWTHNDSGDPILHLVGMDGRARGEVRVAGAALTDWEDLSAGSCPGGRCLYVADIGDNQAARPSVTIYRIPEPAAGAPQTRPAEALNAVYPDGPQDAEALFVLPDGAVFIVTKGETGDIALYRLPRTASAGATSRLERVAELRAGPVSRPERITGAAASPDGQWLALRTLRALHFYRTGDLASGRLGEPLTQDLQPLEEPQGEAVEMGPGGTVFLSSEGGKKSTPASLSRLTCTLPGSA
jgi:hypothetical protein